MLSARTVRLAIVGNAVLQNTRGKARNRQFFSTFPLAFARDYDSDIMPVEQIDQPASPLELIGAHQRRLRALGSRQSGHLCNLALATLKYLILQGESDSVRLQAAKQLLELAPIQMKLQAMAARAAANRTSQRRGKGNQDGIDQLLKFIEEGGESAQNLVLEMLKTEKNLQ